MWAAVSSLRVKENAHLLAPRWFPPGMRRGTVMLRQVGTLQSWTIDMVKPDTATHRNVEIREVGLDSRGARLVHVRMLPGSRIVGTTHDYEHELVVILKGRVTIDVDGRIIQGKHGVIVNVPAGISHGYVP